MSLVLKGEKNLKKFKPFLSLKQEEEWINSVQEEGYQLTNVNLYFHIYTFEKNDKVEDFNPYTRLDFRDKSMSKETYLEYITLFSDSGWQLVKGSRYGGIQYFQQMRPDVTREIFSDEESKQSMKRKYIKYGYTFGILFLAYFIIFTTTNSVGLAGFFNPKSWYLNPELWEMSGSWFWKAFIFETPFVLLRMLPLLFFLYNGLFYLGSAIVNSKQEV
jgi:hypothetical protein